MKWIVPTYQKVVVVGSTSKLILPSNITQGCWYLLILALAVLLIILPLTINKKSR
jgi:hypothetical protein